jgi:acyl-coenzyme A thioesterase PaaI-like protein
MSPAPLDDPQWPALDHDILVAVAQSRRPTLHFLGHFFGLEWSEVGPGTCVVALPARVQTTAREGATALSAIAVLADVAMGGAIRAQAPERRLSLVTTHIMIELWLPPAGGAIVARTFSAIAKNLRHGMAWAQLTSDDGTVVGVANASFRLRDVPTADGDWFQPWERNNLPAAQRDLLELTGDEHMRYDELRERARIPDSVDPFATLFGISRIRADSDAIVVTQAADSTVLNRTGSVQGGMLLGLALEAQRLATQQDIPWIWPLRVDLTYLRRQRPGLLRCTADVTHRTKRNVYCRFAITGDDGLESAVGLSSSIPAQV